MRKLFVKVPYPLKTQKENCCYSLVSLSQSLSTFWSVSVCGRTTVTRDEHLPLHRAYTLVSTKYPHYRTFIQQMFVRFMFRNSVC